MSGRDYLQLSALKEIFSGQREPAMQWKWYIESFPDIGGRRLPPPYLESISLPMPMLNTDQKEIAATTVSFPGASSIDSFEMVLKEDVSLSSIGYVQDWQSLVQNPLTGGYRVPAVYWRDFSVKLIDTRNIVYATAEIRNAWPLGASQIQLDQSNEFLKINVQMNCTACIMKPVRKLSF